jgi:hypothetical protein
MRENHSSVIEMMTRIVVDRGMVRDAIDEVKVCVINVRPVVTVVIGMRKVSTMTALTHKSMVIMTTAGMVNMVAMNPAVDMGLFSGRWGRVSKIPIAVMRQGGSRGACVTARVVVMKMVIYVMRYGNVWSFSACRASSAICCPSSCCRRTSSNSVLTF